MTQPPGPGGGAPRRGPVGGAPPPWPAAALRETAHLPGQTATLKTKDSEGLTGVATVFANPPNQLIGIRSSWLRGLYLLVHLFS